MSKETSCRSYSCDTFLTGPRFEKITMRSMGYDLPKAICDIVDNSVERNVASSQVAITITYTNQSTRYRKVESIEILDNGCGMDYSTLLRAFTLGAETGKEEHTDFGKYGMGMKTAALGIASKLSVYTIQKGSSNISIGTVDINHEDDTPLMNIYEVNLSMDNDFVPCSPAVRTLLENGQGTVVRMDNCDYVKDDALVARDVIVSELGFTHGRIIDETGVDITVFTRSLNKNESDIVRVAPMNYICEGVEGQKLMGSGPINDYPEVMFDVYYIPPMSGIPFARSSRLSGLYVYRNNRMVAKALNFPTKVNKEKFDDPDEYGYNSANRPENLCVRVDLFFNGELDKQINTPLTKITGAFDTWEFDLRRKICETLAPYIDSARWIDETNKSRTDTQESAFVSSIVNAIMNCKEFCEMLSGSFNPGNGISVGHTEDGKYIVRKVQVETEKKEKDQEAGGGGSSADEDTKKKNETKQKDETPKDNATSSEQKSHEDFAPDFNVLISGLGAKELPWVYEGHNVVINSDNVVYKKLWKNLSDDSRRWMITTFVTDMAAAEVLDIYSDPDVSDTVDELRKHSARMFQTIVEHA